MCGRTARPARSSRCPLPAEAGSFLVDDLIVQRYIELEGSIRRVMTVVKMRGSEHPTAWRAYDIGQGGITVGEELNEYRGIITGVPVPREDISIARLSATEIAVLNVISQAGESEVEPIVQSTRIDAARVQWALERLVRLGYLVARSRGEGRLYRPAGSVLE